MISPSYDTFALQVPMANFPGHNTRRNQRFILTFKVICNFDTFLIACLSNIDSLSGTNKA